MLKSVERLLEFVGDMNATEINDHIKARPDGFVVSFRIDNEWLDGWNRAVLATVEKIEQEVSERFMELPVDADGVPVHVGERVQLIGNDPSTVSHMSLADDGWRVYVKYDGGVGTGSGEPKRIRHYHEPTVEDVLREFADEVYADTENEIRDRDFLCAKYAKRLTLAEGENA